MKFAVFLIFPVFSLLPAVGTAQVLSGRPILDLLDIIPPPPPTFWPPPPVYWLSFILLILLVFWLVVKLVARQRQYRFQRQIDRAFEEFLDLPPRYQLIGVNRVLRRVALTRYPRDRVAALHSWSWQAFLTGTSPNDTPLDPEKGRFLVQSAYEPIEPDATTAADLIHWARRWLWHHRPR